jgi:hypothetical protein
MVHRVALLSAEFAGLQQPAHPMHTENPGQPPQMEPDYRKNLHKRRIRIND